MNKKIKQRESNIELLRIISMLMIVLYHFLIHAIIPNMSTMNYILTPLITSLHIGVPCFILISGYCGINFSLRSFVKLFVYCSIYSILIYISGILLGSTNFIATDLKYIVPYQWWYIPVYLCLFLLAPIINIPISNASRRRKILYIIILVVISFGFGQFVPSLIDGKNPVNFILIYYIGNFLKTEIKVIDKTKLLKFVIVYLIFNILLFLAIMYVELFFPLGSKVLNRIFFQYNGIGLLINAVGFFLIFVQLKINSKIINWIAASTLAVYLIHENNLLSPFIYDYVWNLHGTIENALLFSIVTLVLVFLVFSFCVFIDKIFAPIIHLSINKFCNLRIFDSIEDLLQIQEITSDSR